MLDLPGCRGLTDVSTLGSGLGNLKQSAWILDLPGGRRRAASGQTAPPGATPHMTQRTPTPPAAPTPPT